jgi:hypothetical protein
MIYSEREVERIAHELSSRSYQSVESYHNRWVYKLMEGMWKDVSGGAASGAALAFSVGSRRWYEILAGAVVGATIGAYTRLKAFSEADDRATPFFINS